MNIKKLIQVSFNWKDDKTMHRGVGLMAYVGFIILGAWITDLKFEAYHYTTASLLLLSLSAFLYEVVRTFNWKYWKKYV